MKRSAGAELRAALSLIDDARLMFVEDLDHDGAMRCVEIAGVIQQLLDKLAMKRATESGPA